MDAIELLKREARQRRTQAILAARRRYFVEIAEIRALANKLGIKQRGRPRKAPYELPIANGNNSCQRLGIRTAIDKILGEGKALTLVELVIEIQRRGCRAKDDPRVLAKGVGSTLFYHRGRRYKRDDKGRWAMAIESMQSP